MAIDNALKDSTQDGIPLNASQIRQFLVDGYLILQPKLPGELHECIRSRLDESIPDHRSNPGNNILPLVPEMRHVLKSPEVHGALQSLLGSSYLEHPHRFCHVEEPSENPIFDREATLFSKCHQDSYTPLARPRHHRIRYARVMYYPQDTPESLGPTHVIPGTQLNIGLNDTERKRPLPISGMAGTVSITHFDVGHAGGINLSTQRRFMVKFIYQRASMPQKSALSGTEHQWHDPEQYEGDQMSLAWSHLWDWLRGASNSYDSLQSGMLSRGKATKTGSVAELMAALTDVQPYPDQIATAEVLASFGSKATPAIPMLMDLLNRRPDPLRVTAIYALGAIGAQTISPLIDSLCNRGEAKNMLRVRMANHYRNQGTLESALQLDDAAYALSAVGTDAVPALIELLEDGDEWARLNAAFALGEMDQQAVDAVPALIRVLDESSHLMVRTAADALGAIGAAEAAAPLGMLFHKQHPAWNEKVVRNRTVCDQIRVNAATALARLGQDAAAAEADLIHALDDRCGQVATFATEALRRIGSTTAVDAMVRLLTTERWDRSITPSNGF